MSTVYSATGRRKTSNAQVRLTAGTGKIVINGRPYSEYFAVAAQQSAVLKPLEITKTINTFDIAVNAKGGGVSGQAGATSLGTPASERRKPPRAESRGPAHPRFAHERA